MARLSLLFLSATAAVALFVALGGAARWGVGGAWDLTGATRAYAEETRRRDALTVRDQTVLRCNEGKRAVVAAIVAGRLTLAEAVSEFRRLHAQTTDGAEDVLGPYIVLTDDEELRQNVIDWVRVSRTDAPERTDAALARLEAEQREHLQRREPGSL